MTQKISSHDFHGLKKFYPKEPLGYPPEAYPPKYIGITGCGDVNCLFEDNRDGMHSNGGCRCRKELMRTPEGVKAIKTIDWLRDKLSQAIRNPTTP